MKELLCGEISDNQDDIYVESVKKYSFCINYDEPSTLLNDSIMETFPFEAESSPSVPIISEEENTTDLLTQAVLMSNSNEAQIPVLTQSPYTIVNEQNPTLTVAVNNDDNLDLSLNQIQSSESILSCPNKYIVNNNRRHISIHETPKEMLDPENLQALLPHVIDVTSTYLKDFPDTKKNNADIDVKVDNENNSKSSKENKTVEKELLGQYNFAKSEDPEEIEKLKLPIEAEMSLSHKDIEKFTKMFKQKRVKLGFTQADVGLGLGDMLGNLFSQTTVCRFEALQLSHNSMCKLYPLFAKWLDEVERNLTGLGITNTATITKADSENPFQPSKKRRKRTSMAAALKDTLEVIFSTKQKPTGREITNIANELNLEKDVVRVWFCNRRQREKKNNSFVIGVNENNELVYRSPVDFMPEKPHGLYNVENKSTSECPKES